MNKIVVEHHGSTRWGRQCLQRPIQIRFTKVRLKTAVTDPYAPEWILLQMRTWNEREPGCAFFKKNWNPDLQFDGRTGFVPPAIEHGIEPVVGMNRTDIGTVAWPNQTPIDARPPKVAIGRHGGADRIVWKFQFQ